ncbi:MAG: DoxX family protein [Candidatus Nitrospinota bacterium M3_3B_026]
MSGLENVFKLAGRLAIAAIFLFAAFGKVMDPTGTISHISSAGIPAPGLAYALTVALEAVSGVLIVIGWRTKYAALALCLFMVPTTYFFHFDLGNRVQMIMALKNLAIMGGLLLLAASGPGRISVGRD